MTRLRYLRLGTGVLVAAMGAACASAGRDKAVALTTTTPIKHLVVIFDENVSFDHYFGTYPNASNAEGEQIFAAAPGTPAVNNLTPALLTRNPNFTNTENGSVAMNPFRLARAQAATSSESHDYTLEQMAYDGGAADLFPRYTGRGMLGGTGAFSSPAQVMGYYDGNTVTALWTYAQHFAMSDNAYADVYGPSTPGALDLIAGQTDGAVAVKTTYSTYVVDDGQGGKTLISDIEPAGDICSSPFDDSVRMSGRNVGDLLSSAHVSWGWFEGGFDLTAANTAGEKGCGRTTRSQVTGISMVDYIPHHEPFQYYPSTANPQHTRPSSIDAIGSDRDGANHQYDLHDFFDAVKAGNFPAVSYLKASGYQDGHAGYSDPLDEQTFLVETLNFLQARPEWRDMAVLIIYDDSDGWYDHQTAPVQNGSFSPVDRVNGFGQCGQKGRTAQLPGVTGAGPVNGRCGPGTRQPFLVISPWAKMNYIDHAITTQSSVLRFIEDNWLKGERLDGGSFDATAGTFQSMFDFHGAGAAARVYLDEAQGTPVSQPAGHVPR
ncbi:MAG: phospholipase C [Vicinamibacterales bacterium]